MKIISQLFVFIFFYSAAFANRDSVALFYQNINKAELAIVDSMFDDASKYYQQAFQYKFPNDKDLENAFIVACMQKDKLLAKKYINQLASMGWNFYDVAKNKAYYPPYIDADFINSINQDCEALFTKAKQSDMPKAMRYWHILQNQDQWIRKFKGLEEDTKIRIGMNIDSVNMVLAGLLINDFGFPSFERTGYFDDDKGNTSNDQNVFYKLYWHQRTPRPKPIDTIALNAVLNGDFRPDLWITCNMYKAAFKKQYGLDIFKVAYTEEEIKEIDRQRLSVMLEPLHDFKKKFLYQKSQSELYKYPKFGFYDDFLLLIYYQ